MTVVHLKHSPNPNSIEFTSNKMYILEKYHLLHRVSGIKTLATIVSNASDRPVLSPVIASLFTENDLI